MDILKNLFYGFPDLWGGGVAHSVLILALVITLGLSLGKRAAEAGVAVTAGEPFYERKRGEGTFRLNYTNSSFENIDKGISILGKVIEDMKKSQ